jgi:hypothetical protein
LRANGSRECAPDAGTILFKLLAPKGSLWIGNGVRNLAAGIVLLPFAFTLSGVRGTPG